MQNISKCSKACPTSTNIKVLDIKPYAQTLLSQSLSTSNAYSPHSKQLTATDETGRIYNLIIKIMTQQRI